MQKVIKIATGMFMALVMMPLNIFADSCTEQGACATGDDFNFTLPILLILAAIVLAVMAILMGRKSKKNKKENTDNEDNA